MRLKRKEINRSTKLMTNSNKWKNFDSSKILFFRKKNCNMTRGSIKILKFLRIKPILSLLCKHNVKIC
jgi:hypothetical protein